MRYIPFVLFLLLVSCAPVKVSYDYDDTVDFSSYKTYNYYSDIKTGLSELDSKRIFTILDKALEKKNLTLSKNPDFYIDLQTSQHKEANRSRVGIGIGGGGRHVGGGVSVGVPVGKDNIKRAIQFDFVDENGKGLFWQAISESSYNSNDTPEERLTQLQTIVDKVLEGYPPKK
ncbi:DUF4136 domain-containing protein [Mangrovimonas cancribranchiae]|uniref:DUF4136 domain-containing protein n=1 Tax=Mangrovimonas cancribranchiae TaxID=3080055 RepID=A0AAU6P1Q4_9FLAO